MTETGLRDVDARVHREVMGQVVKTDRYGHHWTDEVGFMGLIPVPRYSKEIDAAWRVVEKLCHSELACVTGNANDGASSLNFTTYPLPGLWSVMFYTADDKRCGTAEADTAPLAICLAALKAVEGR